MLALDNASRRSVGTMMKFWMLASTAPAISQRPQVPTAWPECTMSLPGHVSPCCKDMKTRSVRLHLTLKVTRLSLRAVTRRAEYGQQTLETNSKCWTVTKTKSSHALSTTKATPLLLAPKITPVAYGRMKMHSKQVRRSSETTDNS